MPATECGIACATSSALRPDMMPVEDCCPVIRIVEGLLFSQLGSHSHAPHPWAHPEYRIPIYLARDLLERWSPRLGSRELPAANSTDLMGHLGRCSSHGLTRPCDNSNISKKCARLQKLPVSVEFNACLSSAMLHVAIPPRWQHHGDIVCCDRTKAQYCLHHVTFAIIMSAGGIRR